MIMVGYVNENATKPCKLKCFGGLAQRQVFCCAPVLSFGSAPLGGAATVQSVLILMPHADLMIFSVHICVIFWTTDRGGKFVFL